MFICESSCWSEQVWSRLIYSWEGISNIAFYFKFDVIFFFTLSFMWCELFYTLIHIIFVDAFNVPDLDHQKNLFRFVFFLWYVCYFLVMQMHAQGVLYCVQILKINLIPVVFFLISTHFYILVTNYMNLL